MPFTEYNLGLAKVRLYQPDVAPQGTNDPKQRTITDLIPGFPVAHVNLFVNPQEGKFGGHAHINYNEFIFYETTPVFYILQTIDTVTKQPLGERKAALFPTPFHAVLFPLGTAHEAYIPPGGRLIHMTDVPQQAVREGSLAYSTMNEAEMRIAKQVIDGTLRLDTLDDKKQLEDLLQMELVFPLLG